MTVQQAIDQVRLVGTIRAENGKLKLRFPESEQARLGRVIETLKGNREAALRALKAGQPSEPATLKGQAIELWRDGSRFFLVADEADAHETMRRLGARRGEVWTGAELELVASIKDQAARDQIEAFKRQMDGCLLPDAGGKGVSRQEWQAQMLNQLFKEQGVLGQPGKITAATVLHGERKGK